MCFLLLLSSHTYYVHGISLWSTPGAGSSWMGRQACSGCRCSRRPHHIGCLAFPFPCRTCGVSRGAAAAVARTSPGNVGWHWTARGGRTPGGRTRARTGSLSKACRRGPGYGLNRRWPPPCRGERARFRRRASRAVCGRGLRSTAHSPGTWGFWLSGAGHTGTWLARTGRCSSEEPPPARWGGSGDTTSSGWPGSHMGRGWEQLGQKKL